MKVVSPFCSMLDIGFPMMMAPMFLVTNEAMLVQAMRSGIAGCFPSLNFRRPGELAAVLTQLNNEKQTTAGGTYGVNLIVQQANPMYREHLEICVQHRVPFYVTSLGNPKEVIAKAHAYGAKVFCDVTNMVHAQKVYELDCDGFVAVCAGAGGHAGPHPMHILVSALKNAFPDKPVWAAGGIADGRTMLSARVLGADGFYIGTRFIATTEAGVSDDYKNAIVVSDADDIVMTERLSGTPCAVINTPYAKKIGYKQSWIERLLTGNARTKKYMKMFMQLRGFKKLEKSIKPGNYQNLWTAGKSVELIHDIKPVSKVIDDLKASYQEAIKTMA